jgi:hypothetical protein
LKPGFANSDSFVVGPPDEQQDLAASIDDAEGTRRRVLETHLTRCITAFYVEELLVILCYSTLALLIFKALV